MYCTNNRRIVHPTTVIPIGSKAVTTEFCHASQEDNATPLDLDRSPTSEVHRFRSPRLPARPRVADLGGTKPARHHGACAPHAHRYQLSDGTGRLFAGIGEAAVRDPEKISTHQVAEAGEHYVLYRLYLLGLVGGQAPRGMAETDLLVMRPDGREVATVQVKTRSSLPRDSGWHMQQKHENIVRDNLWYVFVGLETNPPLSYVIYSGVVAEVISRAHRTWLSTPGRGGHERKDSKFRRLCPDYSLDVPGYPVGWIEQYREGWDVFKSLKVD